MRPVKLNIVQGIAFALLLAISYTCTLPVTGTAYAATKAQYRGNINSKKYHNSSCRYFNCKNCVVVLSSPAEARKKGYIACKVCGG
ncbi:endonuclease Q family protein [Desulfovibrio sp. OttesenSCG-928-F07]|nr:endonuclease Q family protein [Desulfovibrio sp. OttesenSCG-928-F07]